MKVNYCCGDGNGRAYEDYYKQQGGRGVPVFHGARVQRGHGIGSIFGGLFRSFFPILKRLAPVIGRKALQTGVQIADDVIGGQSLKEAAKNRVGNVFQEGINRIAPAENDQSGSGLRRRKRRRQQKKKTKSANAKRKKSDIFS